MYRNLLKLEVEIDGTKRFGEFLNLSYGGCLVEFYDNLEFPMGEDLLAIFIYSNKRVKVQVQFVRKISERVYGFTFIHDELDALIFLRDFLESFRKGFLLSEVNGELMEEKYKGWRYFRGQGSVDLLVDLNKKEELVKYKFSYLEKSEYFTLEFDGAKFSSHKSNDVDNHYGKEKLFDTVVSPEVARFSLLVFVGLYNQEEFADIAQKLINSITENPSIIDF